MIYVFNGPSGSGKTTITNNLSKTNNLSDYKKIITSTTRKPRVGEKNGVDYYFLTKEEFKEKQNNGKIIASTQYANNNYGVLVDVIEKNLNNKQNNFIIVDQQGIKDFKEIFNKNQIVIIYIHRNVKDIINSLKLRNSTQEEFLTRIKQLKNDIKNILISDIIIDNSHTLNQSLNELQEYIKTKRRTSLIKKYIYYVKSKIHLCIYTLKY